jgi:hypothetical protein
VRFDVFFAVTVTTGLLKDSDVGRCVSHLVPFTVRKVRRRILGPVYGNEKENWRILTNKEIYAIVKNLP